MRKNEGAKLPFDGFEIGSDIDGFGELRRPLLRFFHRQALENGVFQPREPFRDAELGFIILVGGILSYEFFSVQDGERTEGTGNGATLPLAVLDSVIALHDLVRLAVLFYFLHEGRFKFGVV